MTRYGWSWCLFGSFKLNSKSLSPHIWDSGGWRSSFRWLQRLTRWTRHGSFTWEFHQSCFKADELRDLQVGWTEPESQHKINEDLTGKFQIVKKLCYCHYPWSIMSINIVVYVYYLICCRCCYHVFVRQLSPKQRRTFARSSVPRITVSWEKSVAQVLNNKDWRKPMRCCWKFSRSVGACAVGTMGRETARLVKTPMCCVSPRFHNCTGTFFLATTCWRATALSTAAGESA